MFSTPRIAFVVVQTYIVKDLIQRQSFQSIVICNYVLSNSTIVSTIEY